MGYRVGFQCFRTSEAAHDYILSQQLPTITAEGTIIRPIKQGHDWYLQNQKVQLSFPECDIAMQIGTGAIVASSFIAVVFLVSFFRLIYKMIYAIGDSTND